MITPITMSPLTFVRYSFIDDTHLLQSNGDNPIATVHTLQKSVETWEGSLKATGGALGPEKSNWYLVTFQWQGGNWSFAPVANVPATLYRNDIKDVRKVVRRIEPHQAEETLGVWIAPDRNTDVQFEKMLEKSLLWADQMRTGIIRKDETWLALQSTIWRTLCYPLNATFL
jgi:hypothetical protein